MAETLEAQAASLRRFAATAANEGQGTLPLDTNDGWHDHDGAEQPTATHGRNVLLRFRNACEDVAPADVMDWSHSDSCHDIVAWRLADEQPAK